VSGGGAALHWQWEASTSLPLAAGALGYAAGVFRLWRAKGAGHGISLGQSAGFAAGLILLVVALCSPLAAMADRLFAAHMVVHEIIMATAAPLIVWGRPWAAFAWLMPLGAVRGLATLRRLTGGTAATLLQAIVIWSWHVPALFRAAEESAALHALQHASFLVSALLFWHAIDRLRGRKAGAAVVCLFATSLHTGFLGALLMVSPRLWFPASGGFGLSPLEDQQLAGAIMWMPGGMVYAAAALALASRWIMGPPGFRRFRDDDFRVSFRHAEERENSPGAPREEAREAEGRLGPAGS